MVFFAPQIFLAFGGGKKWEESYNTCETLITLLGTSQDTMSGLHTENSLIVSQRFLWNPASFFQLVGYLSSHDQGRI